MAPVCEAAALLPCSVSPAAQHHHRFESGGPADRFEELVPVVHPFQVKHHTLGVRIVGQVVEDVHRPHLSLVAHADELLDPDAPALAGLDHLHADVARLRGDAQFALPRVGHDEADGVKPALVGQQSHAVRADEGHAGVGSYPGDLALGVGALGAHLREAGGDGHRSRHAEPPHCSSTAGTRSLPTASRASSGTSGSSSRLG